MKLLLSIWVACALPLAAQGGGGGELPPSSECCTWTTLVSVPEDRPLPCRDGDLRPPATWRQFFPSMSSAGSPTPTYSPPPTWGYLGVGFPNPAGPGSIPSGSRAEARARGAFVTSDAFAIGRTTTQSSCARGAGAIHRIEVRCQSPTCTSGMVKCSALFRFRVRASLIGNGQATASGRIRLTGQTTGVDLHDGFSTSIGPQAIVSGNWSFGLGGTGVPGGWTLSLVNGSGSTMVPSAPMDRTCLLFDERTARGQVEVGLGDGSTSVGVAAVGVQPVSVHVVTAVAAASVDETRVEHEVAGKCTACGSYAVVRLRGGLVVPGPFPPW